MKSSTSSPKKLSEKKEILWDQPPGELDVEQVQKVRAAIQKVNPWQSLISCVDGRQLENDGDYVQTLGGELQSILWIQFCAWRNGNEMPFSEAFVLNNQFHHQSHLRIGVHSGPHAQAKKGVTDCGFADNLAVVIEALGEHASNIRAMLNHGAQANSHGNIIDQHNENVWTDIVQIAKNITERAQTDDKQKIMPSTEMFQWEEKLAGTYAKELLVGEHAEQFAHVNLASGTSANTAQLNSMDLAGFNLDLWYSLEEVAQAKAFQDLNCDDEFIKLLTLGLYQATERVLRPDKPPLPIIITESSDLS